MTITFKEVPLSFFKKIQPISLCLITLSLSSSVAFAKTESSPSDGKNYNVMVNPLGLLIGSMNASINAGVAERITLGVGGSFFNLNSVTGAGAHVRANFYLSGPRLADGWYVSPLVEYYSLYGGGSSLNSFGTSLLFGYHWIYDSGFNIMLGGGVKYSSIGASLGGYDISVLSGTHGTFEFNIGYAW